MTEKTVLLDATQEVVSAHPVQHPDLQVRARDSSTAAGHGRVEARAALHHQLDGRSRGRSARSAAGLTSEAARWLWATFRAVVSSGWATLAVWWNS